MISCEHKNTPRRKRRNVQGQLVVQRQCDQCLDPIGKPRPLEASDWKKQIPLWEVNPKKRPNAKKRAYQRHLKSKYWRELRVKVLIRDGWSCRICGEHAEDVGHLTYVRFGNERLSDVQAQCSECNQAERTTRYYGRVRR